MAKVEATRSYGGATELTGEGFEEAVAAAQAHVERTGATLVHAFEDERVIAGQGTIGLELAEQAPDAETVLDPDRRRRTRRRDRARAEGATARRARHRRDLPAGLHDRGRHRREASRRAAVVDPRARARRHGLRLGRGDLGGARPLRRAHEAPRRGCGRGRARGAPRRTRARDGVGRRGALGREHRRDDAHLGAAPRAHRGRPLPRDSAAHPGSPGRAAQRARPDRAGRGNVVSVDHHREGRTTTALQTELEIIVSTRDEEHCQELLASIRDAGYVVERVGPPK